MSHHLETTKEGKVAFAYTSNQKPWHGLGNEQDFAKRMSAEEMANAAHINWTVSKKPVFVRLGDKRVKVPGKFALVRDSDDNILSVVGSNYKPIQNVPAMQFFDEFVEAGNMRIETAGSLMGGKFIFALARVGHDFALGKDEMRSYLLLYKPHVHGASMMFQYTNVAVVCWNTLNLALGAGLKGDKTAFRVRHSRKFDEKVVAQAKEALGLATQQGEEFKEAATFLSNAKASKEAVEAYFSTLSKFNPENARTRKDGSVIEPRILEHFRKSLELSPGHDLSVREGTWWGALNAVTYTVDHVLGKERDTALANAWLGDNVRLKRKAFRLALDSAK